MKDRKSNIASFIETLDGDRIIENTVLLGAGSSDYGKEWASSNAGGCINSTKECCEGSYNGGNCKNALEMCNNSTNHGTTCNNSAQA